MEIAALLNSYALILLVVYLILFGSFGAFNAVLRILPFLLSVTIT